MTTGMLDVALGYIARGWNPVPIPFRSKAPADGAWQTRLIDESTAPHFFNSDPQNIGVQLGPASHGLTDVDLDAPEAVAIGPYLLPPTKAKFGRASKRASHLLYFSDLSAAFDKATLNFDDPVSKGRLLELRIGGGDKGAQTIFPGSVHDSGEPVMWEEETGEPANVSDNELLACVKQVAAGALIARNWPPEGGRHDAARCVGGFLGRIGASEQRIKLMAEAIARAAGDEEWRDRISAAQDAAREYREGGRAYGLPKLIEIVGEAAAKRIAEWLNYDARAEYAEQAAADTSLGEWDAGDDPGPIPPRQWLLGNQFCCGFISSIVSAGGGGKSALRLLQFISLALGRPLCGQHVFRRSRVLLVSLEDDRAELQRRIKAVLDHYNVDRSELRGWLFCATPRLAKLAQMTGRTRVVGPLEQQLRNAIARCQPDLISLDPFIKTHALEENDSGDMDFVCDLLAKFAIEFGIAIDSPHHVHKGTLTPGDADSGRGSSGIRDAGRLVYTLTSMSEDEAKAFNVATEDRGSYVRLDSAKVNIAARSGKPTWFRLVGVSIDNATPEYPAGDTIQVVEPWSPPDTWADVSPVTLNAILDDIDRGLPNGQRYSNAPAARERAAWPVVAQHCPDKPEGQCREIIHTWLRTGLLYAANYDDPVERRERKGLRVDATKRPSV